MVLKKLPKNKDLRYIDPVSGEVCCTYNQCYKKFVEKSKPTIYTPVVREFMNSIVKFRQYFHECAECGRMVQSPSDARNSKQSYFQVAESLGPPVDDPELVLTKEEIEHYSKIIQELREKRENSVPYEKTIPSKMKRRNKYGKRVY